MEWQPIETAPMGKAIAFDAKKGLIMDAYLLGAPDTRATYGYYNNTAYDVTHWMPLPAPPEVK